MVDLVDIAASQCNHQITRLCMIANVVADLLEVFIFTGIVGVGVGFILREPDSARNLFAQIAGKDAIGVLFPGSHNIG